MDKRYKKKAYIGVAAWLLSPLTVLIPAMVWVAFCEPAGKKPELMSGLVIITAFLVVPFFVFCWGGGHLAMAKGYSKAVLIPGIFGPPGQLIMMALLLFAMPDKCPDPLPTKPKRRLRRK